MDSVIDQISGRIGHLENFVLGKRIVAGIRITSLPWCAFL